MSGGIKTCFIAQGSELEGLILTSFGYNPLSALTQGGLHQVPSGRSVFEDTLILIEKYGVGLLRPLLLSEKSQTAINALHVYSELKPEHGKLLIPDVIDFLYHKDPSARWYVMEGLIVNVKYVSVDIIGHVLEIISDDSNRVRKKIVEFIAAVHIERLVSAIELMPPNAYNSLEHKNGRAYIDMPIEAIAEKIPLGSEIERIYAYASILRWGYKGVFLKKLRINIDELGIYVEDKIQLLKKRNSRKFNRENQ